MVIIETPIFTADVVELLPDDDYSAFQRFIALNPTAGPIVQGTGGLRKVRWAALGKGKRGGVRVIYYYVTALSQIRMLVIYKKGIKDDLTPAEKKVLKALNEEWG